MTNVIPLRQKDHEQSHFAPRFPMADEPLSLNVPANLARSIRLTAGMHSKDPQDFLIDWLKSGFPENAD